MTNALKQSNADAVMRESRAPGYAYRLENKCRTLENENKVLATRLEEAEGLISRLRVENAHLLDYAAQRATIRTRAEKIIDEVVQTTGVPKSEWFRVSNHRPHAIEARFLAMRRFRDELKWSYPKIGSYFHRDHTTVLHACNRVMMQRIKVAKDPRPRDRSKEYAKRKEQRQQARLARDAAEAMKLTGTAGHEQQPFS